MSQRWPLNAKMVFDAYKQNAKEKEINSSFDEKTIFVPRDPLEPSRESILVGPTFTKFVDKYTTKAGISLIAFMPTGHFKFSDCEKILSTDKKKIVYENIKTPVQFHQALCLIYGEETEQKNRFTFDPWYHIDSLANATRDINRVI